MRFFESHTDAQVTLLVCNNPQAGVITIAHEEGVETLLVDREQFYAHASITEELHIRGIDLIVLAGFLWLIPEILIQTFQRRIINIHPSLLPKFGGRGMYGKHVHAAVLASGETETGITIHFVNEKYDEGKHLAQFRCPVLPGDTTDDLAKRVQELEHQHFASIVSKAINNL